MKAATKSVTRMGYIGGISIHAAREGGDGSELTFIKPCFLISIHAAREGGDTIICSGVNSSVISIHAAREGGDLRDALIKPEIGNFNPRRP